FRWSQDGGWKGADMGVAEDLAGRLASGELVIIDGGMGSQLQAEGVPMDHLAWSARANLDQPDVVQRVHEAYIGAGAEVIIANTFAASRAALEPAGLGGRVAEANRNAARPARAARDAAATRPDPGGGSRWPGRCRRSAGSPWTPTRWAPGSAVRRPRIPGFPARTTIRSRLGCWPRRVRT